MRRCRLWRTGCPWGSGPSTHFIVIGAAALLLALVGGPWAPPAVAGSCSTGIELVSRANNNAPANGDSEVPAVNGDGCVVAFKSIADNLASGTNKQFNVFVRDRSSGTTTRIPPTPEPNEPSFPPALNQCVPPLCAAGNDGQLVAFSSAANNLLPQPTPADANNSNDVFVFDRSSGKAESLTFADKSGNNFVGGGGADKDEPPSVCADGSLVAFASTALHLEGTVTNPDQHLQVYVHDRTSGTNTLVSVVTVGANAGKPAPADSAGAAISGDGCVVAFYSTADTLVAGYTSAFRDVFARDLCADPQTTELVSVPISGAATNGPSQASPPSLSYDGRLVAFASDASNLVEGDDNNTTDVFVRDRLLGVTLRISQGANGESLDSPSRYPSISADGRFVAFQSAAFNPVQRTDIFVVDITDGVVRPAVPVSVPFNGGDPDGNSINPQISGDGSTIVFQSTATNLVSGSTGGASQIFAAPNPPTPTPTNTASPTDTETPTPTNTAPTETPTPTLSPTSTAAVTPTLTLTSTPLPTLALTFTPSPTATAVTATATATRTLTPTAPGVPSATPTWTATASRTATLTPTISQTPVGSPTQTPGGGGSSGGGGGCSCGIDPGASAGADPSAIFALALPLLLRLLRHRTR